MKGSREFGRTDRNLSSASKRWHLKTKRTSKVRGNVHKMNLGTLERKAKGLKNHPQLQRKST